MMAPLEMARNIARGLLSFPVTHFDDDYRFLEGAYREHCGWLLERPIAGLFAAGGTGEFFSLTPADVQAVLAAAVAETAGRVPVIAGIGYGTALASEMACAAEQAGADGVLLLPPYLMVPSQEGLIAHVEAVCRSTSLGVIVYNRDNAVLNEDSVARLCERNANLVGFKDGHGDLELMMRIRARMGDRLVYVGGLPTAETFALAYDRIGVTTYSSAIFNFLPDWAVSFYQAIRSGDQATALRELNAFVLPYVALRNTTRGYAVSIVKAGMKAIGRPAGPVRPPLTDLKPEHFAQLAALIERVSAASERLLVGA